MNEERARVLVVDDDLLIRRLISKVLERKKYQVHAEPDGEGALASYYRFQPHLVVLDVVLPGENGYRISRAIKSSADLRLGVKPPPVLLITGRRLDGDESRETTMMEFAKADGVLYKPFEILDFLERVEDLLHGAHGGAPVRSGRQLT